ALPRNAEIDALSVRWEETTSEAHVILSLSRPTTPSGLTQILYVKERSDSGTGELVDLTENDGGGGTQTVAQGSGVGPRGEVVGTCDDDPSVPVDQTGTPTPSLWSHAWSTPVRVLPIPTAPPRLAAAAYRNCDAAGNLSYTSYMTGFTTGGPGGV